jgi:hypothetical protein
MPGLKAQSILLDGHHIDNGGEVAAACRSAAACVQGCGVACRAVSMSCRGGRDRQSGDIGLRRRGLD